MNYHPWQTLRLVALPSSLILGALSLIFEMSNAQAPGGGVLGGGSVPTAA